MSFKIDSLLVQENMDTRRLINEDSIEESFLDITLKYIKESNNEFRECTKEFYISLLEASNNETAINESFSDFFLKIKEIISRFLKFIKSLFERFVVMLNGAVKSDKYIKKNKSKLKEFGSDHEFKMDVYTFSIDPVIPVIEAEVAFNSEFAILANKNTSDKEAILKDLSEIYNSFVKSLDKFYNEFRARVIGKGGSIISTDYANELFCVYRNGDSSKSEKTIDSKEVFEALARFENYDDLIKITKANKDKIDKDYDQIKKKVESMSTRNNDLDYQKFIQAFIDPSYKTDAIIYLDTSFITKADLFIKAKTNQVIEMTNIHSLAFSSKLDAVKECFKQDKEVLYKALYKVTSTPNLDKGGK